MDYTSTMTIERDGIEIELSIVGEVSPGTPARRYGAPEDCCPAEDAEAEICAILCNGVSWDGELSDDEEELAKAALLSEFEDDDSFNEGDDYDDE